MQLSGVRQAEGGGGTVCWDRYTLCLHELTAAGTHSHGFIVILCSNAKEAVIYSEVFWGDVQI